MLKEEKKSYLNSKIINYTTTSKFEEEVIKLNGLKNFLKDYCKQPIKEDMNIDKLENYIILLQLFNMDKNILILSNNYFEMLSKSKFESYENIKFIHSFISEAYASEISHFKSKQYISYILFYILTLIIFIIILFGKSTMYDLRNFLLMCLYINHFASGFLAVLGFLLSICLCVGFLTWIEILILKDIKNIFNFIRSKLK